MPHLKVWELTTEEAERFAERYWAAKEVRLAEFFSVSGLPANTGTRDSLVAATGWVIDWWVVGGEHAEDDDYPMWYLPPPPEGSQRQMFKAPALRMADALGYLWLDYVSAEVPELQRGRNDTQDPAYNKPTVWAGTQRHVCPWDFGYGQLLAIKQDDRPNIVLRAGRDPEGLAALADTWITDARGSLERPQPPPAKHPRGSSGEATVDAVLERLRLDWPLQRIHIDERENAEIAPYEPEAIYVIFDDVSCHEFTDEIDALAEHLQALNNVRAADRGDCEYIRVELEFDIAAKAMRDAMDATTTEFMRRALATRASNSSASR